MTADADESMFCPTCGADVRYLDGGGCGGLGVQVHCHGCGSTYTQVTGGIVATPGGEKWRRNDGKMFNAKDFRGKSKPLPKSESC